MIDLVGAFCRQEQQPCIDIVQRQEDTRQIINLNRLSYSFAPSRRREIQPRDFLASDNVKDKHLLISPLRKARSDDEFVSEELAAIFTANRRVRSLARHC